MKDSFTEYLKSRHYSPQSIATYRNSIQLFLDWLQHESIAPDQVSYNDLLLYVKHCSQRMTQRGVVFYMTVIRHFYDHLIREGELILIRP